MIYADTCPLPLHIIEREIILILKEKLFLCSDQLPVIKNYSDTIQTISCRSKSKSDK